MSWEQSLRGELTDMQAMRGLRALDLSHCRQIKDAGGLELALALDDDDWLLCRLMIRACMHVLH